VSPDDVEIRSLIRSARAAAALAQEDVASGTLPLRIDGIQN
jgi:hypothetical protein